MMSRRSRFSRIALLTGLVLLLPIRFAAAKNMPLFYQHACTQAEKWGPEKSDFAKYVQNRVDFSRKGIVSGPAGAQSLLRALSVHLKKKGDRTDAAIEYWKARTLFDLKLTLQAAHAFNQIIARFTESETRPFRSAALSCLARIHQKYPTLVLERDSLAAVKAIARDPSIPLNEKFPFLEGLLWSLERARNDAEAAALFPFFKGTGFFEKLAEALIAARKQDDSTIVKNVGALSYPELKRLPRQEQEGWKLLFAMAQFDVASYDEASKLFDGISNKSNLFVRALVGQSWTRLSQKKYEETIGVSSNLIVGGLNKTFAPDAYETLAIALIETCNYNTVLTVVNWFKRTYESSHRYLADLQAQGNAADLYQLASKFLLGKIKMPERVGTDWLSDPVFLANQGEINAQIDSEAARRKLRSWVAEVVADPKYLKQSKEWAKSWQAFDVALNVPQAELQARQTALITEIRESLKQRNRRMIDALNRSAENLQLIEVEAYEKIGDRLIAESGPSAAADKKGQAKKEKRSSGAVWDWGSYSGSIDEHGEVWEDELGALQADLKKTCDSP